MSDTFKRMYRNRWRNCLIGVSDSYSVRTMSWCTTHSLSVLTQKATSNFDKLFGCSTSLVCGTMTALVIIYWVDNDCLLRMQSFNFSLLILNKNFCTVEKWFHCCWNSAGEGSTKVRKLLTMNAKWTVGYYWPPHNIFWFLTLNWAKKRLKINLS